MADRQAPAPAQGQGELPLLHYTDSEGHRYSADLLDLAAQEPPPGPDTGGGPTH